MTEHIPKNIESKEEMSQLPPPPRKTGIKTIEVDDELMDDIRQLVSDRASTLLMNIVADLHAADVAGIMNRLNLENRNFIFNLLDKQTASEVLLELDREVRDLLLESFPLEKITTYIDLLASDDAADIVAELPAQVADKVLKKMSVEESAEVQELLRYREDTAGGIMGTEYVAVLMKDTVRMAIKKVRTVARSKIPIYNVYVIDEEGLLVGVLLLESLVLNPPSRKVYKIMESDAKSVNTDADQEYVAEMFKKYNLVALPVVDKMGKLVGRITVDDIVDVIEEEHSEDMAKMIGSDADELERRSPAQIAMLRLPWVLITLALEFLAGVVVHLYDKTLSQVILLASFMPIVSAISGNTGLQSAAIVVRAMATGHISFDRWWQPILRQLQTTLIIGSVCGLVIGLIATGWHGKWEFGLIVGVSMFLAINVSGFIGTSSPMISKRLGFDPTLTAGPFETAFQDVVGITIFLSLATTLLHWIL